MDVAVKPGTLQDAMDRPLVLPWWRRPRWQQLVLWVAGTALVILAIILLLGPAQRRLRMSAAGISVATVEQSVYRDFIPLRGEVVPRDTFYLDALEGGLVARVLVQAGDRVQKGEALVELSNTALELEVQGSVNAMVQSITTLQKHETSLEIDRANNERLLADADDEVTRLQRELGRREELAERHVISVEERDRYRDQLASALRKRDMQHNSNERLEAMRLQQQPQIQQQIETLQQSLRITHGKLGNLTVRAPVSGLLTAMDLKIGENQARGARLGEITPDTGVKLTATIDEFYLGRVREGQVGRVARDGRDWALTVTRVYPQVQDGGFRIDLAFSDATPAGLLRGQSLQGRLSLGDDAPGVVLASGPWLEASGGDWAFVLAEDGRSAGRRRIRLGRRNADQVEVLAGLRPGERIIISDYNGLDRIERIDLN